MNSTPGLEDGFEGVPGGGLWARYVQDAHGVRLGVPTEWLEGPVGEMFRGGVKIGAGGASGGPRRMVEEVA